MNEQRFADKSMSPAPHVQGLADKVVALDRRRRAVRQIAATAAAVVVLTVGLTIATLRPSPTVEPVATVQPPPPPQKSEPTADVMDRAKELSRQADDALTVVAQLRQSQRMRQLEGQLEAFGPLSVDERRQEASARALLAEAYMQDQMLQDHGQAASLYAQVVQLYPETSWARYARERLQEMQR